MSDDRRNPAGGIAEGTRTVRKGGWLKFGDDYFYAPELAGWAGQRVWIHGLEDAFSPLTAECVLPNDIGVTIHNLYYLNKNGKYPAHLEFIRQRAIT